MLPPRLNQAFETAASGGGYPSNEITRRTFLKRTGGATVASLVAWNLAAERAEAQNANVGSFASLGWLRVSSTRWRVHGTTFTVRDGHPEDLTNAFEALWMTMGNEQHQYKIGDPSEYDQADIWVLSNGGAASITPNGNGTTTYSYEGPLTLKHVLLKKNEGVPFP